ncbi:glucosyltransferase domain-containing protein [Rahnella sp. PD4]|uniref:glucosyltransferase domain-containing protein n=1 Tax=Rahnella sp. PD4 TaxID=3368611 RepID=UPI003B9E4F90
MKSSFRSLLVCTVLFVLPLLLANIYYIDDNGRAALGYTNWGPDGRPLADIMIKALFLSAHISDIFPLPLILGVLIISASLTQFARHFLPDRPLSTILLVTLTFFCNPYLAEIFSYRFDVLTLSAALGLSLLYCCWTDHGKTWIRFVTGTAIIVAIYCLYQTVINILVIMVIAAFFRQMERQLSPGLILITLCRRFGELMAGTIIYLKLILPSTFSGKSEVNHPVLATDNLLTTIINNLHSYSQFINDTLVKHQGGMRFLMLILAVAVIAGLTITVRYLRQHHGAVTLLLCFAAVVAPFIAVFMIPGSLLLLQNALLTPRSLVGLSGFMLLSAWLLTMALPKRLKPLTWLLMIPVIQSLVFFYAYGNALREQAKFNDNLVQRIKSDTHELDYNSVYFIYSGTPPHSPVYENSLSNYPVLAVLVPDYFSNWYWPVGNMTMNGLQQRWASPATGVNVNIAHYVCQTNPYASNQDYKMWKEDSVVVIDFNRTRCQ